MPYIPISILSNGAQVKAWGAVNRLSASVVSKPLLALGLKWLLGGCPRSFHSPSGTMSRDTLNRPPVLVSP